MHATVHLPHAEQERGDAIARRVTRSAALGELGVGYFALSTVALHRLRPDLDPATRYVSEYARGPWRPLMTSAFGALGTGILALAAALAQGGEFVPADPVGVILLGCAGTAVLVDGVFATDPSTPGTPPTTVGKVHGVAALVAFGTLTATMLKVSLRLRRDDRWHTVQRPGLALAVTALGWLAWLLGPAQRSGRWGWPQRALIATIVLWLLLVSRRLRAIAAIG